MKLSNLLSVPLLVGAVLVATTLGWAGLRYSEGVDRERDRLARHAHGLADALRMAAQTRPEAAEAQVKAALRQLRPRGQLVNLRVWRGEALIHEVKSERQADQPRSFVVPLAAPPRAGPPGLPGRPWSWATATAATRQLRVEVILDARLPPHLTRRIVLRLAPALVMAWLAIAALMLLWRRTIRTQQLSAELSTARQAQEALAELNLAAAGLAHETKNPLGIIHGLAQRSLADPVLSDVGRQTAEQIIDETDRAVARLGDFINFARLPELNPTLFSVGEAIASVVTTLSADFDDAGVALEHVAGSAHLRADRGMLVQVLVNLLLNSLHASAAGTTTRVCFEMDGSRGMLRVEDEGHGIAPAIRSEVFKPYVSGRPDGHGLGLSIVRRIARQHGWTLDLTSGPDGTVVRLGEMEIAG